MQTTLLPQCFCIHSFHGFHSLSIREWHTHLAPDDQHNQFRERRGFLHPSKSKPRRKLTSLWREKLLLYARVPCIRSTLGWQPGSQFPQQFSQFHARSTQEKMRVRRQVVSGKRVWFSFSFQAKHPHIPGNSKQFERLTSFVFRSFTDSGAYRPII